MTAIAEIWQLERISELTTIRAPDETSWESPFMVNTIGWLSSSRNQGGGGLPSQVACNAPPSERVGNGQACMGVCKVKHLLRVAGTNC